MKEARPTVLIADDEPDIVTFVSLNLEVEGFDVLKATTGTEALEVIRSKRPDLVILDVMMPELDGYEVCEQIRADPATRALPVIMLTAKSLPADRIMGLTAGADDYMMKPFDPLELILRVRSALRRAVEMRAMNPLTQLPGNVEIQEEIGQRIAAKERFAVMYIDLDHFKQFNDHYGFARGDEAIKLLASCVTGAMDAKAGAFIGHIGGDDFIALVRPSAAEPAAKKIISSWDRGIVELCDPEDVRRGYIEITDRRDVVHRYPICSVSIGIVKSADRPLGSHWEASEIATEMKRVAKRERGSSYAVDRRRVADKAPSTRGRRPAREK